MSLFRVRDFWSFDLDQLPDYYPLAGEPNKTTDEETEEEEEEARVGTKDEPARDAARFIVSLGKFHSIGRHDVFVCASLSGLICILQVPEAEQPITTSLDRAKPSPSTGDHHQHHHHHDNNNDNNNHRQLLCASQLGLPIVDVKCGHFASTLKQSIGVLSFDKLIVYQVKRRQVDLLTSIDTDQSSSSRTFSASSSALDENLFSHKLEEHHRVDLLATQLAASIRTLSGGGGGDARLNRVAATAEYESSELTGDELSMNELGHASSSGARNRNKHLQLPQRDLIVVQYHNQFVFTLIDHKRVVGHFTVVDDDDDDLNNATNPEQAQAAAAEDDRRLDELSKFMGPMPMALIKDHRGLALIISRTDNKLHRLQVAKLTTLAKQSVMKRVAKDLLESSDVMRQRSSLSYGQQRSSEGACITIDLASMAEWSHELAYAPVEMNFIARLPAAHARVAATMATTMHSQDSLGATSQLLVMSRYHLDLFSSSSGHHLWSQRFENPIICIHSYALANTPDSGRECGKEQAYQDRMLSLVCTDCLSADNCNLIVLEEERIAWSALLNTRPMQLWRTNLSKTVGAIAVLDSNKARLSLSYLGTNCDSPGDQLELEAEIELDESKSQLSRLYNFDQDGQDERLQTRSESLGGRAPRLEVDTCLEALNQWPNIRVVCRIRMKPQSGSTDVIQNIVATLEFDDLLMFESKDSKVSPISDGVIQVQLGSCWPDSREPISFEGQFFLGSSNTESWDRSDEMTMKTPSDQQVRGQHQSLMPKSLKVKVILRFNVLHLGSLVQEESFMLPLNLVARLAHIDYSSGQGQTLVDVMANLSLYKRQPIGYLLNDDADTSSSSSSSPPYYVCDLFIKTPCKLIDIVDEIIESDLVCRGMNSETANASLMRPQDLKEKEMSTMENINLLAQSLDCRLKYNSIAHSATSIKRQSSEDNNPAIMISIALKVPGGAQVMQGLTPSGSVDTDLLQPYTIIWLHICDLQPSNNSTIPHEIVKLHSKEWTSHDKLSTPIKATYGASDTSGKPLLISIECDSPMPILFLQNHLIERFRRHPFTQSTQKFQVHALSERMHDDIQINANEICKMHNFIAISANLHERLTKALVSYEKNLVKEFWRLKNELGKEYCKFHVSTMTSVSLAKRLINLPDHMEQKFTDLSTLTKHYQLNLIKLLGELEKLKKLDYQHSKIPGTSDIVIEDRGKKLICWPEFKQIIN